YIFAPGSVFLIAYLIDKFKVSKDLKTKAALQDKNYSPVFDWKKLINYAWQIIIFFLAYELLISIDLYMVKGMLHDDNLTGIYNGALTVGRIPYYIFYAMTIFLLPMVSKSTADNNHKETRNIIGQSLRIMMILLVPMIILMSVFAQPILFLFYGKHYLLGAGPMAILEYGVGFLTIFYVLTFAVNGAGKTKIPMIISVIGVILNIILNYILIKKFSIVGSAMATSITSLVIMVFMLWYLYKVFGVTIKLQSFLKTALAGIILYFVARLFSQGEIIFILWSIILFAFYLVFLYLLGEIKKEDIDYLRNISSRKKVAEARPVRNRYEDIDLLND
ncbi:MAG: polysaccharide biosynthesis C-terminal domain-containing protein, partial [Candidatus Moranbacteria bacterium]|nr:polysaccharide biosynthesis C-terminal domain-containing protein [Candidatus Moranbacteria bacterium]